MSAWVNVAEFAITKPLSFNKPLVGMLVTVYTNCALVLSKSVVSKRVELITVPVAPSATVKPKLLASNCSSFTLFNVILTVSVSLAPLLSVVVTVNTSAPK